MPLNPHLAYFGQQANTPPLREGENMHQGPEGWTRPPPDPVYPEDLVDEESEEEEEEENE